MGGHRYEDQEMIFEKFRQAFESLTKTAGTGSGAPSQSIVSHFGGRLWVQSEPGKGSTFSFTVPRYKAEVDVSVLEASDLRPAGVAP